MTRQGRSFGSRCAELSPARGGRRAPVPDGCVVAQTARIVVGTWLRRQAGAAPTESRATTRARFRTRSTGPPRPSPADPPRTGRAVPARPGGDGAPVREVRSGRAVRRYAGPSWARPAGRVRVFGGRAAAGHGPAPPGGCGQSPRCEPDLLAAGVGPQRPVMVLTRPARLLPFLVGRPPVPPAAPAWSAAAAAALPRPQSAFRRFRRPNRCKSPKKVCPARFDHPDDEQPARLRRAHAPRPATTPRRSGHPWIRASAPLTMAQSPAAAAV